ncbi:hypothetical protein OROMI_002391 [Orobanche minor]
MKKKVKQYSNQIEAGALDRRYVLKDFSRMLDIQYRKNYSLYVRITRPNCKQIGKEIDEQLSEQGLGDDDQCIQDDFFACWNFCIFSLLDREDYILQIWRSVRATIIDEAVHAFKDGRNEKQIWWYECSLASLDGCVVGGVMYNDLDV